MACRALGYLQSIQFLPTPLVQITCHNITGTPVTYQWLRINSTITGTDLIDLTMSFAPDGILQAVVTTKPFTGDYKTSFFRSDPEFEAYSDILIGSQTYRKNVLRTYGTSPTESFVCYHTEIEANGKTEFTFNCYRTRPMALILPSNTLLILANSSCIFDGQLNPDTITYLLKRYSH